MDEYLNKLIAEFPQNDYVRQAKKPKRKLDVEKLLKKALEWTLIFVLTLLFFTVVLCTEPLIDCIL